MRVEYEFYTQAYGGDMISEAAWKRIENLAFKRVDALTFGRLTRRKELPKAVDQAVNMAICETAEILFIADRASSGIASESKDGHAVTFADRASLRSADQIRTCVLSWLADTGLLCPAYTWQDGEF